MEGGNAFCAMLQAAAAQAAKSTTKSGKGTVSTNVADYKDKDLQAAFARATVTTSVLHELIANRKTVFGANADNEKLGMTEEQLTQAHAVLDDKRLAMVNRTVVRLLHDAVYPSNTVESPATSKLRSSSRRQKLPRFSREKNCPPSQRGQCTPGWCLEYTCTDDLCTSLRT